MSDEARPRRRRRADVLRALLACGLALGLGSAMTLGQVTTGASQAAGPTKAAQLDVLLNDQLATVTHLDGTYVQTSWVVPDMLPGEFMALQMTVKNGGQVPLDFVMDGYVLNVLGFAMSFEFYENSTASNPTISPVAWNSFRQGSCVGGTRLTPWWYLAIGPDNVTKVVTTKQRLNVGQSKTYCVLMALSGAESVYSGSTYLNRKGTAVFIFRGTQVGAP